MFEIILGGVLVVLYLVFWAWHSPWKRKLTNSEIDHYMARIEKLPLPPGEVNDFAPRVRRWAEADDGKGFYMFNLIHYFPELRKFPGAPDFKGTPQECNVHYMKSLKTLWLSHAAYPRLNGFTQSESFLSIQPERTWSQMTVVRYPNRRTLLKVLSNPAFAPVEPYKFMAMELDLVPVSGNTVLPDLGLLLGGALIIVFLLISWLRAARLL
jgi:hypothetical protein